MPSNAHTLRRRRFFFWWIRGCSWFDEAVLEVIIVRTALDPFWDITRAIYFLTLAYCRPFLGQA